MVLGSWEAGEQRSFLLPTLKPYAGPGQNGAAHPRKQALGISTATATWKAATEKLKSLGSQTTPKESPPPAVGAGGPVTLPGA